jgi:caffeoyl-CoA O-methyltransferase
MLNRPHMAFEPNVQQALTQYIIDTFVEELPFQQEITRQADAQNLPQISLRPDEGWHLYFLLKLIQATTVIEIGTLAGYSASWILRALPEQGKLYTFDVNPVHADFARAQLNEAGYGKHVEIILGNAHITLHQYHGLFDAVFLDADKSGYPDYLAWAVEHVRPGGLIMAHNAFRHGDIIAENPDEDTRAMQQFNQMVAEHPRLLSTLLPAGDGMIVAMVK